MMHRALAPSGVPIRPFDIAAGLLSMVSGAKSVEDFQREICRVFGVRHAVAVSSGRAGLALLFLALQQLYPGRKDVLIPAYTSYSLPSAVVKAGLRVSLYDVDPDTLSPARDSLIGAITDNTLCIVVCHLFGYPADLDLVLSEAKKRQIPVIDDAAQAMGARYRGRQVGTFGTAGLFSLSRGKNITAVDGGVVVTDDDRLARELASLPVPAVTARQYFSLVVTAVALCFLLHPWIYWLPRSLPSLKLGASVFEPCFGLRAFTAFQAAIAQRMLGRLDDINSARIRIAGIQRRLLSTAGTAVMPQLVPGAEPVYLRFPILVDAAVEKAALGVVRSYPAPIHLIPGLQPFLATKLDFPGAAALAQRIITLPTQCYVREADCEEAVRILCEAP